MSLTEPFITSILAAPKTANTAISKDIGIYSHLLHPTPQITAQFKKSSTRANSLAVSSTHIYAAQIGKAVVHVYSRERGNQEAIIPFPERISSIALLHDGLLALGTEGGRIILWEVLSGRTTMTGASHLQSVTALVGNSHILISGSEDSNILIWDVPRLLSSANSNDNREPARTLSNHRAAITSLALGHSATSANFIVSASRDNTVIVWSLHGDVLRTFLLPAAPTALALDPADRAVYVGFQDGTIQALDLYTSSPGSSTPAQNSLYDANAASTPITISPESAFAGAPPGLETVHALGLSYDGTTLLTGHESGKIAQWETGSKKYVTEIADVNAPVTNLLMGSPFPETEQKVKAGLVVKPKIGEGNVSLVAQLDGELEARSEPAFGFGEGVLEGAIAEFLAETAGAAPVAAASPMAAPAPAPGAQKEDAKEENDAQKELARLRKENAELKMIVKEQEEVQKRTWSKFRKGEKGGKVKD
jgi:pre-rRNA-processing protein IPI3